MVRYYGWYSNKSRGLRKKQGIAKPRAPPIQEPDKNIEIIDVSDYQPPRIPSKKWRECIKKIYEVDGCSPNRLTMLPEMRLSERLWPGGEIKIISFITNFPVVRQILEHLAFGSKRHPETHPIEKHFLKIMI